jgi:hypothetical protein
MNVQELSDRNFTPQEESFVPKSFTAKTQCFELDTMYIPQLQVCYVSFLFASLKSLSFYIFPQLFSALSARNSLHTWYTNIVSGFKPSQQMTSLLFRIFFFVIME